MIIVDIEQRVSALEKLVLDQQVELMAMDILLRSLIVSSPESSALEKALASLSSSFSDQLREHGFSTGRAPKVPQAVEASVLAHVARWQKLFPANPSSSSGGHA